MLKKANMYTIVNVDFLKRTILKGPFFAVLWSSLDWIFWSFIWFSWRRTFFSTLQYAKKVRVTLQPIIDMKMALKTPSFAIQHLEVARKVWKIHIDAEVSSMWVVVTISW